MKFRHLLLLAIVSAFGVSGCDADDRPAEEGGQAIDEKREDIQNAAKDAGNAVEDACEDVKEGVDADDTDC